MTLTQFMARSTWVANAFEWEKLLKCHLKEKASRKLENGQNIDYSEKENGPRASSAPALGLNTQGSRLFRPRRLFDIGGKQTL